MNVFEKQGYQSEKKLDEEAKKIVWNAEKVQACKQAIQQGMITKIHPFFDGDVNWKRGEIVYEYSKEEQDEIKRCKRDILYFAEKYCYLMTDNGYANVNLRDYQKEMLTNFASKENRFHAVLASRQIGKTTTSAIYIAHYLCFNVDKTAFFLANKSATTTEVVSKTKKILEMLPFFLKPGALSLNVYSMIFDNGCRLMAQTTTKNSGIGFTIHLLYLDEFAHIDHTFIKSFYENVYPTLSSSKVSRIIITSTPNGRNKFYEIYSGAVKKENEFKAYKVDWWQVPGRDEAWKKREISNLGSEEAFNEQYGNLFLSAQSLLLDAVDLKRLEENQEDFINKEVYELDERDIDYSKLLFKPSFNIEDPNLHKQFFVISVDIAEGSGGDNSVINIFNLTHLGSYMKYVKADSIYDYFTLEQVAIFCDNKTNISDLAKLTYILTHEVLNPDNVKIVVEYNTYGEDYFNRLRSVFDGKNDFDEEIIVRYFHNKNSKLKALGLKVKNDNKAIFCQDFRSAIKKRRILITDRGTVYETSGYGKLSNGSYGGQLGNDDRTATCINVSTYFSTLDCIDMIEEYFDTIPKEIQQKIESFTEGHIEKSDGKEYDIYSVL